MDPEIESLGSYWETIIHNCNFGRVKLSFIQTHVFPIPVTGDEYQEFVRILVGMTCRRSRLGEI